MPALRVDDFDQGVAVPELHLGTRTSRASSVEHAIDPVSVSARS